MPALSADDFDAADNPAALDPITVQRIKAFVCTLLNQVYEPMTTEAQAKLTLYACSQVDEYVSRTIPQPQERTWRWIAQQAFAASINRFEFNHQYLPTKR